MEELDRESADEARSRIVRGDHDRRAFRKALLRVRPNARDTWLDRVLGLRDLPDDDPALPRGCVPYIPCAVDPLLRAVDQASIGADDVFVDLGSGVGRAAAFVHLLTGAEAIGVEIQSNLVVAARDLASRLGLPRVSYVEGDAAHFTGRVLLGSVFFLYCPFSGDRLAKALSELESIATARTIRVCCVDLSLPPCPWLTVEGELAGDLAIYRSTR